MRQQGIPSLSSFLHSKLHNKLGGNLDLTWFYPWPWKACRLLLDQALVSAQLHVLPPWQMDWLIVLHMSKLKSQASEWHAWSPLLVNNRTGRVLYQFITLSPRPSCHDPLLSSMWTHSKPWNPSHQRVSPLSFTVKVKYDSWAVLQVVTTSQKCLASHWKSSLLKPDQLHFLVVFSPTI